ncbi:MAG: nucleotidyltransferase family protein [Deltaproteobacteria bacterium]|nr:MAG: nucleotidyltransferase family protein [Deltaproteobacteria bacterium]
MIAAIVLSAGESRRMGSPKALLPIKGKSFIEQIVAALKATKVAKIIVVLGHNPEPIKSKVEPLSVSVVINPDYLKGQLSSLIAAIRSLQADPVKVDGVLVHLVDHPLISRSVVNEMIDRFFESKKLIVIPTYKGKRGHPVLLSSRLFPELLKAPPDQGAKAVVHAHRDETLEMETDDEGVIIDIDTPDEYRQNVGSN